MRNYPGRVKKSGFIGTETIFDQVDHLSTEFAGQSTAGAVDYFHVAFAIETEVEEFVTFDKQQWKIARQP